MLLPELLLLSEFAHTCKSVWCPGPWTQSWPLYHACGRLYRSRAMYGCAEVFLPLLQSCKFLRWKFWNAFPLANHDVQRWKLVARFSDRTSTFHLSTSFRWDGVPRMSEIYNLVFYQKVRVTTIPVEGIDHNVYMTDVFNSILGHHFSTVTTCQILEKPHHVVLSYICFPLFPFVIILSSLTALVAGITRRSFYGFLYIKSPHTVYDYVALSVPHWSISQPTQSWKLRVGGAASPPRSAALSFKKGNIHFAHKTLHNLFIVKYLLLMNVAMYVNVQFSSLVDPGRMEVNEISGVNQCIYSFFITLTSTDFKFT